MESAGVKKLTALLVVWCTVVGGHVRGQVIPACGPPIGSLTSPAVTEYCFNSGDGAITISQPAVPGSPTYQWMMETMLTAGRPTALSGNTNSDLLIDNNGLHWGQRRYYRDVTRGANTCRQGVLQLKAYPRPVTVAPATTAHVLCPGANAVLTLGDTYVTGTDVTNIIRTTTKTYQWQSSAQGVNIWTNLTPSANYSGQYTDELTITNTAMFHSAKFRCIVSTAGSTNCSTTSAEFTVDVAVAHDITIPVCGNALAGTAVVDLTQLDGQVSNLGSNVTVEWYTDRATTSRLPNANNVTVGSGTSFVFAKVTKNALTSCSAIAMVSIENVPTPIVLLPAVTTVETCPGVPVDLSIATVSSVDPAATTLQWERFDATAAAWTPVSAPDFSGETTGTLHAANPNNYNGDRFRCVATENGCSGASGDLVLSVIAPPVVTDQSTTVCEDLTSPGFGFANLTLLESGMTGGNPHRRVLWYANALRTTPVFPSATGVTVPVAGATFYARVENTTGGCAVAPASDAVATISVSRGPTFSMSATTVNACDGQSVTLQVTGVGSSTGSTSAYTYHWQRRGARGWSSITTGPFSGNASDQLTISNVTGLAAEYRCLVGQDGCQAPSPIFTLNVGPPVALNSVPPMSACGFTPTLASADLTTVEDDLVTPAATSNYTFVWYTDALFTTQVPNATAAVVNVGATPTPMYVKVTNNASGCISTGQVDVNARTSPTIIMPSQTLVAVCDGATATFALDPATTTGPTISYQWQEATRVGWSNIAAGASNFTDQQTISLKMTSAAALSAGQRFRCVVSDGTCTATSGDFGLQVNAPPVVTGTPSLQLCEDFSLAAGGAVADLTSLEPLLTGGDANLRVAWYTDNTYSTILTGATQFAVPVGRTPAYAAVIDNLTLCSTAVTPAVLVSSTPRITMPANALIDACDGSRADLELSQVTNGTQPVGYQWQQQDHATGGWSDIPFPHANFAGQQSAKKLEVGNVTGFNNALFRCVVNNAATPACTSTSGDFTLNVLPAPTVSNPTVPVCEDPLNVGHATADLHTLDLQVANNNTSATVEWFSDNLRTARVTAPVTIGLGATTFYATVSVGGLCSTPAQATVNAGAGPIASVSATRTALCSGDVFAATIASAAGAPSWTVSSSTITGVSAGTGTAISQRLENHSSAAAQVTYSIVASAGGCVGPVVPVVVTVQPAIEVYSVTGGKTICATGPGELIGLSNSQAGVNYTVLHQNAPIAITEPGTGGAFRFATPVHLAGNYSVQATAGGCSAQMTGLVLVLVTTVPQGVGVIDGPEMFCSQEDTVQYTVNGYSTVEDYSWTFRAMDKILQHDNTVDVVGTSVGETTISVTPLNRCGAGTTATKRVTLHHIPEGTIDLPQEVYEKEEVTIRYTTTASITGLQWNFGDNTTARGIDPKHAFAKAGPYDITVKVVDKNGCSSNADKAITVIAEEQLSDYSIKNLITANADDVNARLVIENIEHFPDNVVTVLNRWGQQVYRKEGYTNDWEPYRDSKELPPGNYVCIVQLPTAGRRYSRVVTLWK